MPDLIRWEPREVEEGSSYGFAGSRSEPAFEVTPPDRSDGETHWMLLAFLAPTSLHRYGETEADAKQQAETWLREFAASLGAVFTEDLRGAPALPGFVPAAALRSELDLLASQHQALGDAKHGQPEALEHLGRAAAFDQVKEILNSLEATR